MKRLVRIYLDSSPWLIFLPFLFLFILIVLAFHADGLQNDEARYYGFANNLLNGYYSPPPPNVNLWNGPGYPVFLMPFVFFGLPLILITLTNAFLQYLSIILLFYAINRYASRYTSLFFSFYWAFYYISYQELYSVATEPLASFLSALIVFLLSKSFQCGSAISYLLLGVTIGLLALTKVIFGYVIVISLFILFALFVSKVAVVKQKKLLFIMSIALLVNIPYLFYTHKLTGKILYFGNSGGMSLYWMSTPFEGEFGDWNNDSFDANCGRDPRIPCNSALFARNHQADIDYVKQFSGTARDDVLKQIALNNIRSHPVKYLRNCISNLGRLFFGVPTSYFYQREETLLRFFPNSIILTMMIFSIIITIYNFKNIAMEINFIVIFFFIYLFLTTLVSAYPRQLYVVVPLLLFLFAFVAENCVIVKFNISAEK
ncbi:hypothetical protein [uncultured Thiodictyon sp.]|uniref:ArnT family glycosyltransferase n=1 Tax=uncultured Thiodictyon sp. TaxID=1846217 RepID=UPI0025E9DEB5|nr:hypothetical protein [uncultured Thiodictyon sp.]